MSEAPETKMLTPSGGLPTGGWDDEDLIKYVRADLIEQAHAEALEAAAVAADKERDDARSHNCHTQSVGAVWTAKSIRALPNPYRETE